MDVGILRFLDRAEAGQELFSLKEPAEANTSDTLFNVASLNHAIDKLNDWEPAHEPVQDTPLRLDRPKRDRVDEISTLLWQPEQVVAQYRRTWSTLPTVSTRRLPQGIPQRPQDDREPTADESLRISELSCWDFDAVLYKVLTGPAPHVYPLDVTIDYLSDLVLGRESKMFRFSSRNMRFYSLALNGVAVPGLTTKTIAPIVQKCIVCGSQVRRIRYTLTRFREMDVTSSVLIAFSNCVGLVVDTIENFVCGLAAQTILEFDRLVVTPTHIIDMLAKILGCADLSVSIQLNRLPEAYVLLNQIYKHCLKYQSSGSPLLGLTALLLKYTSVPWFQNLQDLVGLGRQETFWRTMEYFSTTVDSFLNVDEDRRLLRLDRSRVPKFLSPTYAKLVLQILNCFIIHMRFGDSETTSRLHSLKKVTLRWILHDKDLVDQKIDTDRYINELAKALNPANDIAVQWEVDENSPRTSSAINDKVETLLQSFDEIETSGPDCDTNSDEVDIIASCEELLAQAQTHLTDLVPFELSTELGLYAILRTQQRLTNSLVFGLFLNRDQYDIENHCVLMRAILLMGSGSFVIGVEERVFSDLDPDGLRLESRESWPPSASEINHSLSGMTELAVRELFSALSPLRMEKFLNFGLTEDHIGIAGELTATNALILVYTVPGPLSILIDKQTISLLGQTFLHLLKVSRIHYAMKTNRRQFSAVTMHFVSSLAQYISSTAIELHWRRLTQYVVGARAHYNNSDLTGERLTNSEATNITIDGLVDRIEGTVRAIARDSFVTGKGGVQLERIFDLIWSGNEFEVEREISRFVQLTESNKLTSIAHYLGTTLDYNRFYRKQPRTLPLHKLL